MKNEAMFDLQHAKKTSDLGTVPGFANKAAQLEEQVVDELIALDKLDRAVINLISKASCLVDAKRIKDAIEALLGAWRIAQSPQVRNWIRNELTTLQNAWNRKDNEEQYPAEKATALERGLQQIPVPSILPQFLPVCHTTTVQWVRSILETGELQPSLDRVLGENIVWCTYGGLTVRRSDKPTRDLELPVAFAFRPGILRFPVRFLIGATLSRPLKRFDRNLMTVSGRMSAAELVHHLYGSNDQYILNSINHNCLTKPDPVPELYHFLQRLPEQGEHAMAIDCAFSDPIPLKNNIVWIGGPEILAGQLALLVDKLRPHEPKVHIYQSHSNLQNAEIIHSLEAEIRKPLP